MINLVLCIVQYFKSMNSFTGKLLCFMLLAVPAFCDYVGAVAEHDLYMGLDSDTPKELLTKNIEIYQDLASIASSHYANILVFPEFGLTAVRNDNRTSLYDFAENFGEVVDGTVVPCTDPVYQSEDHFILRSISCMSMKNKLAVLVNTIESVPCTAVTDDRCPDDKQYLFNTDIVLDEKGSFVAKYHKSHEWPGLKPPYDQPEEPSVVTYKSSWGVEYGIFTCFDIMFQDPAVTMVKSGIEHFLYPVMQGEIGEKTLITSFSKRHEVTMLSANLGSEGGDAAGDCSGILTNGEDVESKKYHLSDIDSIYKDTLDNVIIGTVSV